jgi:ribonucleoside-diphosphate reductase alpha chain
VNQRDEVAPAPPASAADAGAIPAATPAAPAPAQAATGRPYSTIQAQEDAPPCTTCGSIMIRSGACYKCANCGTTSGCA